MLQGNWCVDAGGENCPCFLAEGGACLTCSRLAGGGCEDCLWSGVCVANEYEQNGRVIRLGRKTQYVAVKRKKCYDEQTAVLALDVGRGMAQRCSLPGSYVFLQADEKISWSQAPISVMRAEVQKGWIWVLIKGISVKTKALLKAEEGGKLLLRGPYQNGLFGGFALRQFGFAPRGEKTKEKPQVLILAKGAGLAPAVLVRDFLKERAHIRLLLDTAKLTDSLAKDWAGEKGRAGEEKEEAYEPVKLELAREREQICQLMRGEDWRFICIFASDYYLAYFGKSFLSQGLCGSLVLSNNFHLCCGEGICGACSIEDQKGQTRKMCKCQMDGETLLSQGLLHG